MEIFSNMWNTISNTRITFQLADAVEILIMMLLLYRLLIWARKERTWILIKAILAIALFFGIAKICQFNTILFLASKSLDVLLLAMIVVFQPELRKFLEKLGNSSFLSSVFSAVNRAEPGDAFSARTVDELVTACCAMSKTRTGALITIEKKTPLEEFITTGIRIDAEVSSQLLRNIFEHNTPLHDGAVVIRGNRIEAATCYLPASKNPKISKDLGTRHRAAVGISEYTDSVTIVVSEETGLISVAEGGILHHGVSVQRFRSLLNDLIEKPVAEKKRVWRRRANNEQTENN